MNLKDKNCVLCGESIASGSVSFAIGDIAVHCECLEEHCKTTNCLGCKIGEYPDCAFTSMKKALMNLEGEN